MKSTETNVNLDCKINKIFETIKWEQSLLYPMIQLYEQKEMGHFKIAIAITSLYLTVVGAIYVQSYKVNPNVLLASPYDIVFAGVTLTLCLINITLIKFIASNRAGCIQTMRQINCLRRAIDSLSYYQLYNECPSKLDDLCNKTDDNIGYWLLIGRHRKLPITNDHFRSNNRVFIKKLIESPDGFLVMTITIFSLIAFLTPSLYIIFSDEGYPKWFIASLTIFTSLFFSAIYLVLISSVNKVEKATNHQTVTEADSSCNLCKTES